MSRLYKEDLYQLILHEVGHTLGLNHNFAASYLHNNSDIHNPEITYQEGLEFICNGLSWAKYSATRNQTRTVC